MKEIFYDLIERDQKDTAKALVGVDTVFWSINETIEGAVRNTNEEATDCKTVVKNQKKNKRSFWQYFVPAFGVAISIFGLVWSLTNTELNINNSEQVSKLTKNLSKKEEKKILDEVLNRISYEDIIKNEKIKIKLENGFLKIVVNPWANVILDGKSIGITPLSAIALKPGKYKLELQNPILKKKVIKQIEIKPKKDLLVRESWI